jgi:hypothetical protein
MDPVDMMTSRNSGRYTFSVLINPQKQTPISPKQVVARTNRLTVGVHSPSIDYGSLTLEHFRFRSPVCPWDAPLLDAANSSLPATGALVTMPTLYGVGRSSLIGEPPDALDQTSGPERFLEQHGSHAGVQSLASLGVEIERGDQQEGD